MNFNKVILVGRLTRDPEIKSLPSGQGVCSFGLATDRFFVDKSGQRQQQTEFHNIVMFGRLAEIASQYLNKGSLALIEGRLRTRNWQDAQGNQRYKTEILAERMQLGPKSAGKVIPTEGEARQGRPSGKPTEGLPPKEEIPIIEENEIDVKDLPF